MREIIYLNHAGTSWPNPPVVQAAIQNAMKSDPDSWPELFAGCRDQVIEALGIANAGRLLLTPSCTSALSIAVSDQDWRAGDQVLTSSMEHHAMHRPLFKLTEMGVDLIAVPRTETEVFDLEFFENALRTRPTRLVAITAASNVTGEILPLDEIIALSHQHGALVLVDAAQTSGWPIHDLIEMNADLFTFAGHKGPRAMWGIGGLYVAPTVCLNSVAASCEIPASGSKGNANAHCSQMPGYCDAGSINLVALASLSAGLKWLSRPAQASRLELALGLAAQFKLAVKEVPGVKVIGLPGQPALPTVAITIDNQTASEIARSLKSSGIHASGGIQCAPLAHRSLGTAPHGVIRFSFAESNTAAEVEFAIKSVRQNISPSRHSARAD